MTAALVEMKVEKKSIRKQEPSSTFERKKWVITVVEWCGTLICLS
jgi:hypothetical protein